MIFSEASRYVIFENAIPVTNQNMKHDVGTRTEILLHALCAKCDKAINIKGFWVISYNLPLKVLLDTASFSSLMMLAYGTRGLAIHYWGLVFTFSVGLGIQIIRHWASLSAHLRVKTNLNANFQSLYMCTFRLPPNQFCFKWLLLFAFTFFMPLLTLRSLITKQDTVNK